MSRKQIFLVAMIGLILTGLVSILPRYINPYLLKSSLLPRHTLDGENDLAELLRETQREEGIYDQTDFDLVTAHWGETGTPGWIRGDVKPDGVINTLDLMIVSQHQRDKKVYIGVHGYDHKCPLCGGTDHELYCVHDKIPREEVERRVDEGLKIFAEAGLKADWYGFPGMTYDERCLEILRNRGFTTVKYYFKVNWLELDMAVSPSMVDIDWSEHTMEEYTWMWRDGVSEQEFQETLDLITVNSPIQILMHIRDFTDQTKALLEYAIDNCGTTLIRCDDITFNNDAPNTENLVRLAKEHDVTLLICVIPSFAYVPSSSFAPFIEATWYMFLCFFVFPVALMVPWAGIFKSKREKPKLKGNPYFPKVSLILPAYNEEKILGKSIKQGLNQDYKGEIEIIVIDDGSTDKTYKIARRYAKKYSNVKVIQHKENLGKPAALNTGFGRATGKISIFSDTDSVLASDLVSKMVPHFEDPKVGMVAGMIVIKNEKNLLTKCQQIEYLFSQFIVRFCQSSHKNVLICPGAATAVRTHIAQKIPSTDRTITEDADFSFAVWKDGWKISQEPEAVSYTEAPEKVGEFITQRKRWLYGVLQTIVLHKWAAKKGNLWVIWAWLGYVLCPLMLLSIVAIPIFGLMLGESFFLFLVFYVLLTFVIFAVSRTIGISFYNNREKLKLAVLMPIYAIYQMALNILLIYLVFAFVTRKGITVRYGGRDIHAL